jgi:hypothetical protein
MEVTGSSSLLMYMCKARFDLTASKLRNSQAYVGLDKTFLCMHIVF